MRDIPFSSEEERLRFPCSTTITDRHHDSLQERQQLTSILTAKEREIVGMVCEGQQQIDCPSVEYFSQQ